MKFILIFICALIAVAWIKSRWQRAHHRVRPPTAPQQIATVRCLHCSVHLPQGDAVQGQRGWYCSLPHRQQDEST